MKHKATGSSFYWVIGALIIGLGVLGSIILSSGKIILFLVSALSSVLVGMVFIGISLILDVLWENNKMIRMILTHTSPRAYCQYVIDEILRRELLPGFFFAQIRYYTVDPITDGGFFCVRQPPICFQDGFY